MAQQQQLRHFVFTLNNPTITPDQLWAALEPLAAYLIFQEERGDNGTPHFQGYCELHRRTRFAKVKAVIPSAHIEPRRGSQSQAKDYASKQETRVSGPYEYGLFTPQHPGHRSDIASYRDAILSGKRKRELLDEFPEQFARFPRFLESVRSVLNNDRRLDLRVELYWGPPGTGKTRKAFDENPDSFIIPVSDNLWFDGYDGQDCLILDDFTGWMKLDHLLRILDIYPVQIPVKGGFTFLTSKKIILTSNKPMRDWYDFTKHGEVKYAALRRRFHSVLKFTHNNSWLEDEDDLHFGVPDLQDVLLENVDV